METKDIKNKPIVITCEKLFDKADVYASEHPELSLTEFLSDNAFGLAIAIEDYFKISCDVMPPLTPMAESLQASLLAYCHIMAAMHKKPDQTLAEALKMGRELFLARSYVSIERAEKAEADDLARREARRKDVKRTIEDLVHLITTPAGGHG